MECVLCLHRHRDAAISSQYIETRELGARIRELIACEEDVRDIAMSSRAYHGSLLALSLPPWLQQLGAVPIRLILAARRCMNSSLP